MLPAANKSKPFLPIFSIPYAISAIQSGLAKAAKPTVKRVRKTSSASFDAVSCRNHWCSSVFLSIPFFDKRTNRFHPHFQQIRFNKFGPQFVGYALQRFVSGLSCRPRFHLMFCSGADLSRLSREVCWELFVAPMVVVVDGGNR